MKRNLVIFIAVFTCMNILSQVVKFDFNPKLSCDSASVTFVDSSVVSDTNNYYAQWNFGNGTTYTARSYSKKNPPKVSYPLPGEYSITLTIGQKNLTQKLYIFASPDPYFNINDSVGDPNLYSYIFNPINANLPDTNYVWNIRGLSIDDTLKIKHFNYSFDSIGQYLVKLTTYSTDILRCNSSYERMLYVFKDLVVYDYVTPNNDNLNDLFFVPTNGTNQYRLCIYSRSGILIYKTEGPIIEWNGYLTTGERASSGTYYYIIESITGPIPYTKNGFLMLIY